MLDIARGLGFDGFFITDDLGMMGIRARFGKVESKGLALAQDLSDEIQSSADGVHLDTMFIDKGFGQLDDDWLHLAIAALKELID